MKHLAIQFTRRIFKVLGLSHILEHYQIKRNEAKTLPYIRQYYSGFVKPDDKIYDIGANVGSYSRVFLEYGAKVIAFEPQIHCQKILRMRFDDESNFILSPFACGAEKGEAYIYKPKSHTIASMNMNWIDKVKGTNRFEGEEWTSKEKIQVDTLDNAIKRFFKPDYIKIDVEGFELDVLRGLTQPVSCISFEVTLPEAVDVAKQCIEYVSSLGRYKFIMPKNNLVHHTDWISKEDMMMCLNDLVIKGELVSADIFCKLYE
jgi:FkbM family methyltransferase